MSTPDFELPQVQLPFPLPSLDPTPNGDPIAEAAKDGGVLIPPAAGADAPWEFHRNDEWKEELEKLEKAFVEVVDLALNLTPVVGQVKGLIEGFVGEDLITGRHLEWWERALNVVSVGSLVKEAEEVEEGAHLTEVIHEIGHSTHEVNTVVHVAHGVHGAAEALGEGAEGNDTEKGGDSERREDGPLEYPEHGKQETPATKH